jgi:hypothetical protein
MQNKDEFKFDKDSHTYAINSKRATGITTIIGVLAKPQLIGWASRMCAEYVAEKWLPEMVYSKEEITNILAEAKLAHQKKKEEAGTIGTDAHSLVEIYINTCLDENCGKPLTSSTDSITKFRDWAIENVDHFLFSERQMFNKEMFIAGTADFAAVMKDGKKLIGDFKTSSGVYGIDYFLQCAGYKILAEAEGDEPYDGCVIVRLGKDGSFDVHYRFAEPSTKEKSTELWNRLMGFLGAKQKEVINYSDIDTKAFLACLTLYRAQATWTKPSKV